MFLCHGKLNVSCAYHSLTFARSVGLKILLETMDFGDKWLNTTLIHVLEHPVLVQVNCANT